MLLVTRSFFALFLIATAAMSANAQGIGGNPSNGFLVSGKPGDEIYAQSFFLFDFVNENGVRRLVSSDECRLRFTISATNAADSDMGIIQPVVLGPGDFYEVMVPFSLIGSGHALIEFSDIQRKGACRMASSARLTGAGHDTRATYADRARFSEVVLAATPYKSATEGGASPLKKPLLVSGGFSEGVELAFLVENVTMVDGIRKFVASNECEVAFTLKAERADETADTVIDEEIVLSAGELAVIEFLFAAIGSRHALIELTEARGKGPCQLQILSRIFEHPSGATAAEAGRIERMPINILGVEDPG